MTTTTRPVATATRRKTCRMLNARNERCTGEVIDPDPAAVQICTTHAAQVWELIQEGQRRKGARK